MFAMDEAVGYNFAKNQLAKAKPDFAPQEEGIGKMLFYGTFLAGLSSEPDIEPGWPCTRNFHRSGLRYLDLITGFTGLSGLPILFFISFFSCL